MAVFSELVASFDADAGKRGKQFEQFVKWFLKNDPEWCTQVDQIWLWEEYPERWGVDCGIDLVFRHKNGEKWAVQAKCYSHHYDITKHDVDKFLSESNRKGIDKRLLITTTDRIGTNAKQVCDAQEKAVSRYMLSNFEAANLEYPATLAELHTAHRKPRPAPRNHQLEAISNVVDSLREADRGQLIMACGTGKTFTTLWIKEQLNATSTLILLPSLGLLSQTLREWTLAANMPFEVLCVCSDNTVGNKSSDEAIHSVADVAFPVTSNVDDIRKFLCSDGAKVVFSTYQSSPLVAQAQVISSIPDFDLVIADEAHRCAGKVDNDFATVLDAKNIRATKRLFATATPRTYSSNVKKAAGERGIDVVGMDDETVFGKVLYSLPFGEAIKRGLLTDYQVVIIGVDNPTIAAWIENREFVKTESGIEVDAESLAAQIGLLKAFKDYDLRRVISFHSRVNRAEQFSKNLLDVVDWIGEEHKPSGTMMTDFVSGEMSTDKRRIKLSQLKSMAPQERRLLTNARCLSEGVDVPSLDGVAFIDPRSSQIDIIQAVGRAIRLSANKTAGTIILPVFIETGIDAQASIDNSNFKPVWDVLNALKAHDDVLSTELDQLRTEMGRKSGSTVGPTALSKIHIDLSASIDQGFGESLRTYLVERTSDSWEYGYGALSGYVEEYHNCLVPFSYMVPNNYRLGAWVSIQRMNEGSMPIERRVRLEALRGWTWDPFDEAWDSGYEHLNDYRAVHGNCLVPKLYMCADGYRLGSWVRNQRAKSQEMTAERKSKLEALEGWVWNSREEAWEAGFKHLVDYSIESGSCVVPKTYENTKGYKLGAWVSVQRGKREKLSIQRQERLQGLPGWTWDPRDEAWETGLSHLRDFIAANDGGLPPSTYKLPCGYRLGSWVQQQRAARDRISSERKLRLEALTGWTWNSIDESWETGFAHLRNCSIEGGSYVVPKKYDESWEIGFAHLREYAAINGTSSVPYSYVLPSGFKLGQWVIRQRAIRSSLSDERSSRLEQLSGWCWSTADKAWETGFAHLCEYVSTKGSCLVPSVYVLPSGYGLGTWVSSQRKARKRLFPEQQIRLEALQGWSWDPRDEAWETGLSHLRDFIAANDGGLPPGTYKLPCGYRLGSWVHQQRAARDRISSERKLRLEALPGWTWNSLDESWETGFAHLRNYSIANGNCRVPKMFTTADGFKLGTWVNSQRAKREKMPLTRQVLLEALSGWTWNVLDEAWETGFAHLRAYITSRGNCLVPRDFQLSDGYKLGSWVKKQRANLDKMPAERRSRLEGLTGWIR